MTTLDHTARYCVLASDSFYAAMVKINENASHAVFVVDEQNRLIGSITDGDIRRALIAGQADLQRPVREALNTNVRFLEIDSTDLDQRRFMRKLGIEQLPLVDKDRHLVGVTLSSTLFAARRRNTPVLLMAGGMGTRLGELTRDRPKPLVQLLNKPIMEHILLKFANEGFRKFMISINHLGDMVRDHFGDGSHFGVTIEYLEERKKLGTAGALSLIEAEGFDNLIVSNCDVICQIEYSDMLDFHELQSNDMTMGVVAQTFAIPFGVVDSVSTKVVGFREKPKYEVSVNAGVYVLKRDVIADVPHDTQFDMPDLLDISIRKSRRCGAFTINDGWIDVGRAEDLERARAYLAGENVGASDQPAPVAVMAGAAK